MSIDWLDIMEGYNDQFKCNFTIQEMINDCYNIRSIINDKRSGHRAAEILGVSSHVFYEKLYKFDVELHLPGGRIGDIAIERIRAIPDEEIELMSDFDIARKIGCAINYVSYLKCKNPDEPKLKLNICAECGRVGGHRIKECYLFLTSKTKKC